MRHVHLDVLFHVTAAFSFALLLVAAFAKWADFWPLGMTVAALGFYVLFGNRRGVAMLSSSLFLVFLLWNISAILVSAPSCGCFGDLKVSPWITGSVDFALSVVWTIILVSLFFS